MMILRRGGGSTNITYVAIRAARQEPRIQTQATNAGLPRLRDLGGATPGRDEEDTTRSPESRCVHGRRVSCSCGTKRCRCVRKYHTQSVGGRKDAPFLPMSQ